MARMIAVRDIEHAGYAALELVARGTRLVVVHAIGPLIAWFGRVGGANLLFWDDRGEHRRGDWRLYGGHRLWTTRPGADEAEDSYAPDNEPCVVRRVKDGAIVTARSALTRVEKSLALRWRDGEWMIEHRIRNTSVMLWSGGAWALTCTRPRKATRYRIPLDGGNPEWDVLTMVIPRRWGGNHTSRVADPQVILGEHTLDIRPRGVETKRMLFAPLGTLEMIDPEDGQFGKTAAVIRGGSYPLATNVAFYIGAKNFMVELETMSPVVTLAPGEMITHVERWRLTAAR
jgi:hypothetical protein